MGNEPIMSSVDAFTAEVIRNTVVAITDEMKTNLMRTAYNMIIYEAEDFTVGLFDPDGNTISIGLGLPGTENRSGSVSAWRMGRG
jgi:N-methylhydantoinase B